MKCPVCAGKCTSYGAAWEEDFTRRYLRCSKCGYQFTTLEVDEDYFDKFKKMVLQQARALVGQKR